MSSNSVLKDISTCKNNILSSFTDSKDICDLMLLTSDNDEYDDEDVVNLIYTQIFPYLYVDETQTDVKPYICCEVDVPRIPTGTIKDMKLIVWAYCHKDCMKYSKNGYRGTRVDILVDMIERQLRDSNKFGIGKLQLDSVTYFFPSKNYYGRQLVFTIPDFKVGK